MQGTLPDLSTLAPYTSFTGPNCAYEQEVPSQRNNFVDVVYSAGSAIKEINEHSTRMIPESDSKYFDLYAFRRYVNLRHT
jgi:hypothetical protein